MPVQPLPCSPDGGTDPGGGGESCCSPSITSAQLCRPDGTPVLVVLRSPCVCGTTPPGDPEAVGWLDLATSLYTPGPPPDGVTACAAGCVDTVCRRRCDDTDGDGQTDTVYSELWCVRADGTAELVLTYQDDPSVPYTPVAPVDCEYGSASSETLTLCDDTGPFLRRYSWMGDTTSFEDVDLDGVTPHVVTGSVGMCPAATPCEEQTTPAATLGLCLADGTPIAVVVTRDCTGTVTQDGWLNLTTGLYTPGGPPAGTMACGSPRSITTAGTFCDVAPGTGDVLGLVLIEYTYGPDGAVASVRLVDAITGATYAPQGEVTTCPAGVEQPERDLLQLCDTAADGAVTDFVRDFARDENGVIVGHADYTLDGAAYAPAGEVGVCGAADASCRDTSSTLLCDVGALTTVTVLDTLTATDDDGWQITSYSNGGCTAANAPDGPVPGPAVWSAPGYLGIRADRYLGASICGPWTGYDTAPVRWVLTKTFAAPENGMAVVIADGLIADGGTRIRVNGQDVGMYAQWNQPATGGSTQVPVTAGPNVVEIEVRDIAGPNYLRGHVDVVMNSTQQFLRKQVTDCVTGVVVSTVDTTLDGVPYTVTGTVGECQPVATCCEPPAPALRVDIEVEPACLLDEDGEFLQQVLVERLYDDQSGDRVEQRYVDPTTGDPIELPDGAAVGPCASTTDGCRNASTLLVCDGPTDGEPGATVADTAPGPFYPYPTGLPVAGAQVLWDGGALTLPPGTGPQPGTTGTVRTLAAAVQAPRPACDTGTAHVTVSLAAEQLGPDAGCAVTGAVRLFNGTTPVATVLPPNDAPAGWSGTLTVEADVPAADLAAGNIAFFAALDTYDDSPQPCPGGPRETSWELSAFTAAVAYDQTDCATQFLRTVTVDCETGATLAVTDTTLDGDPYTVTGMVGQCTVGGGTTDPTTPPCGDTELLRLCDVDADGATVEFLRTLAYDCDGQAVRTTDTLLDGITPYTPAGTVGRCPADGRSDVELVPMCVIDNNTDNVLQRILAEVVYDSATGARTTVGYVDPRTWGPVPVPGGARIDLCETAAATACGDTELVQLCDLTYDPQAPIPTPAGDFTLTGNVVAGNQGTTLWFAQANQEANGVAELAVGGLLPATLYQFRFASAWIGAGGADPAGNAAIYQLDVLDGVTVLATRTRNTSNGSTVFPGGVLSEDLPPLAFIAPATGAVTIRITDQSTGGPINDRDLFLMPLEVRTAVLTLNSTPFLRRFTYDCDGALASSQDLDLDGTTPYAVAGEVGQCAGSGDGSPVTVPPCAANTVIQACRCDDTDGDGVSNVDYVELIAVDCDGVLSSLGTYTSDLTTSYTPVAPVDCEGEDIEPATGVQARRVELAAGESWDAAGWPTLQSVTAVAHGGTGTVTTDDGPSTLHTGEAVSWSVGRDVDAALRGPLLVTADTGTVALTYTIGVTL